MYQASILKGLRPGFWGQKRVVKYDWLAISCLDTSNEQDEIFPVSRMEIWEILGSSAALTYVYGRMKCHLIKSLKQII